MATKSTTRKPAPIHPQRFNVGDYVYGPFIFFDAGTVVGVGKPNRYGYRMVDIQSDGGTVIGTLEVWPSATREEATRRYTERYGRPPAWEDEDEPMCFAAD